MFGRLEPITFWSGYTRFVRHDGRDHKVWVARGLCSPCAVTHALLPGFVARNRLDSIETIGSALEPVVSGQDRVRPVAERLGVPHATVRGWVRSFERRAASLAGSFAGLAVELSEEQIDRLNNVTPAAGDRPRGGANGSNRTLR